MNRTLLILGLIGLFFDYTIAGDSRNYVGSQSSIFEGSGARFYTNDTSVTVGLIPFAVGVAIAIGLLILLIVPFLIPMDGGFGDYTGYSTDSTYSSYARSFDPYAIDWEKFSILDWIAVAEETWKKFEPGNLDCQKRLICEMHQNTSRFGFVAKRMVDVFSYLEFAEVLRLPQELKAIVDDYLDAADRGRSMKKDCGEFYSGCDFSVKKLFSRVSHNEI